MKIAVVGMGVAGSYLLDRLSTEHKVIGFERLSQEKFDAICAWGTSKNVLSKYSRQCGLNFEDYVLSDGKEMRVKVGNGADHDVFIKLKGLCTYNKHKLIEDLAKGQDVRFGKDIRSGSNMDDFDLILDCTSLSRAMLPRLPHDVLIPCIQYKVKFREPPYDDFFIKPFPGLTGYFWYFPLEGNYAHVGAGDYHKKYDEELGSFLNAHPNEIVKKVGRPIRVIPPSLCEPFFNGKVVGVGESIGSVYPLLGEGIIPSLQCSEVLVNNLDDLKSYRRKVLERFKVYDYVFRIIKAKLDGRFSIRANFMNLLRVYLHMRFNESRYGMDIKLRDMMKVLT